MIFRPEDEEQDNDLIRDRFRQLIGTDRPKPVLEAGTRRSVADTPTNKLHWFPYLDRADYVMIDALAGPDVDVVCDLHALPEDWSGRFQAFVAIAVLEHLERPWIAAQQIYNVLGCGGLAYIQSHQTFPLHGYPNDFFRFSTGAIRSLFAGVGFEIVQLGYSGRSQIVPPQHLLPADQVEAWNLHFPSYILVQATMRKPGI